MADILEDSSKSDCDRLFDKISFQRSQVKFKNN